MEDYGGRREVRYGVNPATGTGTGELTGPAGVQPKARVTYSASWPDPLGRQQAAASNASALVVENSVTGSQTTQYVYGTTLSDSGIASSLRQQSARRALSCDFPRPKLAWGERRLH